MLWIFIAGSIFQLVWYTTIKKKKIELKLQTRGVLNEDFH